MTTGMAQSDKGITSGWRLGIYASGNLGKNILWGTGEATLLFMLTSMLGLDPALAGGLLLASLVFDAVLDPVVGHVADRSQRPAARYGTLILAGAPLAALSFLALYSLPLMDQPSVLLIFGLMLAFRLGYSLIDVPHNALIRRVRSDGPGRARLAGYRFFFSSLAALVLALALAPLVNAQGPSPLSPHRLFLYAACMAALSCAVMIASWTAVRRQVEAGPGTHAPSPDPFAPGDTLRAGLASPVMRLALIVGTLAAFALPLFNKSVLFLVTAVFARPDWASPVLTSMVAGQFAGLGGWIWLSSHHDRFAVLAGAHGVAACGALLCLATGQQGLGGLLAGAFIFGAGASGVYTIIWGLIAEGVDDVRARTGTLPEAGLFALAIFLQKAAIGLGFGLFGLALGQSGYEADRSPPSADAVILLFGLGLPAIGAALCAAILLWWRPSPLSRNGR